MRRSFAVALALGLGASTLATASSAQSLETPSPAEYSERMRVLTAALERDEAPSARWRWGWVAGFGGLVAFNVVRALTSSQTSAVAAGWTGAGGSALGLITTLVMPPRAQYAASELRVYLRRTGEGPQRRLRYAEGLLRECAANQDFTSSWLSQVGRAAVAAGLGLILILGFHSYDGAALNVGGGLVIGQFTVRLAPTAAIDAWERYTRRWPDAGVAPRRWSLPVSSLALVPTGTGFSFVGAF